MNQFTLVLILFIINLISLISFYMVDFGFNGHLNLATPFALIAVTAVLGIGVCIGYVIRKQQAHNITI